MRKLIVPLIFLGIFSHALMTLSNWTPQIFWIVDFDTALVWGLFEMFFAFPLGFISLWYAMNWAHDRPRKPRDAFTDEGEWME